MRNNGLRPLFVVLAIAFACVLAGANIFLGDLNQDEGWYLAAAKACGAGLVPYRDFFFTQAPLMPLVYGGLQRLWEPAGLAGARLLTALFGMAAAFFAALAAARAVPAGRKFAAGSTAFLLLAGNVYHSYFTVIPKTYALASLLLAAGFCAIAHASPAAGGRARGRALAAAGGFLVAASASTRISIGLVLAAAGCFLLARARALGGLWVFFGLGGALGLCIFLAPSACADFDAFRFANFFHGGREAGGPVFAAGSLSRLARAYMPLLLLLSLSLALPRLRGAPRRPPAGDGGADDGAWNLRLWGVSFGVAFIAQLCSPFPYDDYQVPLMPLAAALASALFWRSPPAAAAGDPRVRGAFLWLFLFCAAAFAFTSPVNETWLMIRKDRFWVVPKEKTDLRGLREAAAFVAGEAGRGGLLTTDPYLAVEARMAVRPGFEMGPFGFFPDLAEKDARRFHVYNPAMVESMLEDDDTAPRLVAFSGYGFAVAAPAMTRYPREERERLIRSIGGRYEKIREIPDFGQEHTVLEVWRRK